MAKGSSGYKNQYQGVGTSFQDQYHTAQQRAREGKEYRHKVQKRRQEEAKELYGQLVVPDTGQSTFDADKRIMAKEWKSQANDLLIKKRNGEISPEEFEMQTAALTGNAKTFKEGAEMFKKTIANYRENKDNISEATPTHILDALDTIDKNPDAVTTKNVNGVPHLVGKTEEGADISVPLADIQNGKGAWRFSTKEDIAPKKDAIVKDLDSFKTQWKASNGDILEGSLGAEKLTERAGLKVDQIIADETSLRAIAADEFGIDYEDFEELGADAVRQQVRDGLVSDITSQLIPRTTNIRSAPQQRVDSRGEQRNQARGNATRLIDNVGASLNDYISTTGGLLDGGAVKLLQGEVGGNIEGIEFAEENFNFFSANDPAAILIYKKGSDTPLEFPADGNPADLAKMIALAKYGDEALANTKNTITTDTNAKADVSSYDFEI